MGFTAWADTLGQTFETRQKENEDRQHILRCWTEVVKTRVISLWNALRYILGLEVNFQSLVTSTVDGVIG
jgi:hypothetical protein